MYPFITAKFKLLKLRYTERATKFEKNLPNLSNVKSIWHSPKNWTLNNPGNKKTDRTEIKFRVHSDSRDCFLSPKGFKFYNTIQKGRKI